MNEQIKIRIQTVRNLTKRLLVATKVYDHRIVLKDVNGMLDYAALYFSDETGMNNEVEELGMKILGLIRQEREKYERGESASPYGAWVHVYPFKMIRQGHMSGLAT